MKGLKSVFNMEVGQKIELGEATLHCYEWKESDDPLFNLRCIRDGDSDMCMTDGIYHRLIVGGELMMSDTRMEKRSNEDFCFQAKGDVLIAGLGLGLILHNLKSKVEKGFITSITVIEKSQDVIDLISPYYEDMSVNYLCADIMEYKPEQKYDTIYFDIWSTIDTENMPEINKLHQKWKRYKADKNSFMKSWMQHRLKMTRQRERREVARYGW